MRLLRMTTRRWMIAVVVVAVGMSGIVGIRAVWQYFVALNRVQYHEGMEAFCRWLDRHVGDPLQVMTLGEQPTEAASQAPRAAGEDEGLRAVLDELRRSDGGFRAALDELRRNATLLRRQMGYHAAMAREYRHVARFPWLPVGTDPPEPQ